MKRVSILMSALLFTAPLCALTPAQKELISNRIFMNECSGKKELLVFWNPHEPFPSLGIGHCIWFPRSYRGKYTQTFPDLMRFFKHKGIALPAFALKKYCPWKTRADFLADTETQNSLIALLSKTFELQTEFLLQRLKKSQKNILKMCPPTGRAHMSAMFNMLESTPQGTFALVDYLNFKGEGTNTAERYQGKGWGLTQVLSDMPSDTSTQHALSYFIQSAARVLNERVKNAPAGALDERALKGWHARINRYALPL